MPKLKNISKGVYRLQNEYAWGPGETLDVPDEVAAHVLEAQAGRFVVVSDEPSPEPTGPAVADAPNRQQTKGRTRFRR